MTLKETKKFLDMFHHLARFKVACLKEYNRILPENYRENGIISDNPITKLKIPEPFREKKIEKKK